MDESDKKSDELPSFHDAQPEEQGGPVARSGFSYQDEVTVSLLLDLLESPDIAALHIETHDDVVLVYADTASGVEYIQIKSDESMSAWTIAKLCQRDSGKVGTSIYERSLARDAYKEPAQFRIVSCRDIDSVLKPLSFPRGCAAREPDSPGIVALANDLEKRCPGFCSGKGSSGPFWLEKCHWDVRFAESVVARDNLLRVLTLSATFGAALLPQQAGVLLSRLRDMAQTCAKAKWEPDREKKIVTQDAFVAWWKGRLADALAAASTISGEKLRAKMSEAGLSQSLIQHASELRREFSTEARLPRYMEPNLANTLKSRVSSEILSLQAEVEAKGDVGVTGAQFHDMCIKRIDMMVATIPSGQEHAAFLKGGMYDIADRCLLRFVREGP